MIFMRQFKRNFYIRHIVEATAGTLYSMAPINRPRKLGRIMAYLIKQLEAACVCCVDSRYLYMAEDEFDIWIESTLRGCSDFCDLNLTQNEVDNGISVDDESRAKFKFTSAYDVDTEDSWKDDFIDLDAAIGNIINRIYELHEPTDCFLCDYNGEAHKSECVSCKLNYRGLGTRYQYTNKPHDPTGRMGWCTHGCSKGVAVCCKDCNLFNECKLTDKCSEPTKTECEQWVTNPDYDPNIKE